MASAGEERNRPRGWYGGLGTITRCARGAAASRAIASARADERRVVELGPDVGGDDERRPRRQQRQRRGDAAGGLERLRLERPAQRHAERAPSPSAATSCRREVRGVDDDVAESGARERLDLPDDERLAAGLEQRLGRRVRQRTHPLAAPGGEDHRAWRIGVAPQNVWPDDRRAALELVEEREQRAERAIACAGARAGRPSRAACRRGRPPCRRGDARRAKMPSTLSCRCTPIHSKSRQNAAKSAPTGRPARARALPVADRPVDLPLLVPRDVRVAQQRDEVVGDRARSPRPGSRARRDWDRSPSGCANGSRDARRRAAARDCCRGSAGTRARASAACAGDSVRARCRATYQSGKRASSRASSASSYGGQLAVARRELPADQRVDRVRVEPRRRVASSAAR